MTDSQSLKLTIQDELGPYKVVHVYQPEIGLHGALVIDNIAAGPSIGGLRLAPDVSVDECFRLARAMTLKNAMARLPHGGGKSVLMGDPKMPAAKKQQLVRALASALANETGYIFGPDMGTDEQCMAWVHDEIGRAVGLPPELGGIPLDELGATGFGLMHAIEAALPFTDFTLAGARIVVQGFGSVGIHSVRFLAEKGAVLIAASDSRGAIENTEGLDVEALIQHKRQGNPIADFPSGNPVPPESLLSLPCDVWIPAARPDVITGKNVEMLQTKIVAQGANIAVTPSAEERLHEKGILCLPDFIANAGGVICAAMEYQGATEAAAFAAIAERISRNIGEVLTRARTEDRPPRQVALDIAAARVKAAMKTRRWGIF